MIPIDTNTSHQFSLPSQSTHLQNGLNPLHLAIGNTWKPIPDLFPNNSCSSSLGNWHYLTLLWAMHSVSFANSTLSHTTIAWWKVVYGIWLSVWLIYWVCVCMYVCVCSFIVLVNLLSLQSWRRKQRRFLIWMTTWLWSISTLKLNCPRVLMWLPSRSSVLVCLCVSS